MADERDDSAIYVHNEIRFLKCLKCIYLIPIFLLYCLNNVEGWNEYKVVHKLKKSFDLYEVF